MVSCKDCEHSRYFSYCEAEGCVCMLTNSIMSKEQADSNGVCDGYVSMDRDDSED